MNIALVVPGGVDRSAEYRVIPVLLSLIRRLACQHSLSVFALRQESKRGQWPLLGAIVFNTGSPMTVVRTVAAIRRQHSRAPFDLVHCIWGGDNALAGVGAARMLGIPSLVHLAGGELVALPEIGYGGRLHWYRRVIDAWPLQRADLLSAASAPIIATAAELGMVVERVPLGVDLDSWPPLIPRRRTTGGTARLIHVASLNRVKDQDTLLRALAVLKESRRDFRLDIVGEDTLGGQVQALSARLGLVELVTFHGFRTQLQLRPLMEAAHVNLVTSLHEAGPLVALEAAVAGVPTVGTAVGHLPEWAPRAAVTVPARDPRLLAHEIARLLDDEDRRLALAGAAAQIALAEDITHTVTRFLALYEQLLSA